MEEIIEELFLMSIKPQYADQIFKGKKKYELRKLSGIKPIAEGSIIIVYSSGKIKRIIGEFRAGRVLVDIPERIWGVVSRPGTGIGGDAYAYIRGGKKAMAIEVVNPRLYPRSVSLEEIRRIIPGWMPPYSYKKINPGDRIYELVIRRLREALY